MSRALYGNVLMVARAHFPMKSAMDTGNVSKQAGRLTVELCRVVLRDEVESTHVEFADEDPTQLDNILHHRISPAQRPGWVLKDKAPLTGMLP